MRLSERARAPPPAPGTTTPRRTGSGGTAGRTHADRGRTAWPSAMHGAAQPLVLDSRAVVGRSQRQHGEPLPRTPGQHLHTPVFKMNTICPQVVNSLLLGFTICTVNKLAVTARQNWTSQVQNKGTNNVNGYLPRANRVHAFSCQLLMAPHPHS